jgi:hypothetical protein
MNDTAQSMAVHAIFARDLLEDGELILLAVRPSAWYVLLAAGPVLMVAVPIAVLSYLLVTHAGWKASFSPNAMAAICAAAAGLRLAIAFTQWMGRVYVLTNRRVLRLRGLAQPVVIDRRLKDISAVEPVASGAERMLGLGGLLFRTGRTVAWELNWTHLAHPAKVYEIVQEAIRKAH